mmetsp:Transcript_73236/g.107492  ORF Transcript_73236/g.107492 Transcript_73236/m.107492 type:complete len:264 (+) Transcript_73236:316-1107(+)
MHQHPAAQRGKPRMLRGSMARSLAASAMSGPPRKSVSRFGRSAGPDMEMERSRRRSGRRLGESVHMVSPFPGFEVGDTRPFNISDTSRSSLSIASEAGRIFSVARCDRRDGVVALVLHRCLGRRLGDLSAASMPMVLASHKTAATATLTMVPMRGAGASLSEAGKKRRRNETSTRSRRSPLISMGLSVRGQKTIALVALPAAHCQQQVRPASNTAFLAVCAQKAHTCIDHEVGSSSMVPPESLWCSLRAKVSISGTSVLMAVI